MIHYVLPRLEPNRAAEKFFAHDIELPLDTMNVADITLTGRYPEEGYAFNVESDMVVRVLEGETALHVEGEEVALPEGATVLVPKQTRYYWSPKVLVRLYVVSTPRWTSEQHRNMP